MTKRIILFLAANPHASHEGGLDLRVQRSALDHEASAIHKELKGSGYRDRFELVTRWATEPHDLLRALRELKPTVVHFSGHGDQDGLLFHGPHEETRRVSPAAIAATFAAAGGSVRLVVLSACESRAPAEALLAHVDCVVWMSGVLHDNRARAFAIGFYGALGEQGSIMAAYRHGNAAISLEGLAEAERPQIEIRAGADAAHIVLAAVVPATAVMLPCPYPGLRPYSADDADHLHGRGTEIEELLGRLRAGEREIYVIGPSGSGKSSLVTAGLLPRLARGAAGLGRFVVRSMRPGEHPAARLDELLEISDRRLAAPAEAIAALLVGLAPISSVLIVIDQLEELFTLADAGEREQFLRTLVALRAAPRCAVIFTLRADFFGAFMESPLCADRRDRLSRIEVYPLRGAALNEAIVRPAGELEVSVEPGLIERLLADAGSEPGVLPLLQETLVQLWDRRQDQTLRLGDYRMLGDGDRSGLAVALARRADALLRELTATQEAVARRILLRLISFGEGRSDIRRQQPRSKLRAVGDEPADFDLVLRRLIDGRLLTADDDDGGDDAHVDLAHEVMVGAWPTLAGWIQTHRVNEQRRRQLEVTAAQWVERGRGAGGLLDPIMLAEAETWLKTDSARELGQSAAVGALVTASRVARDRQWRRRRRVLSGAFAVVASFAVVVSALKVKADRRASESQRLLAQSYKETGRELLLEGHPYEAMPYLMEARLRGEKGESLEMLIWMAARPSILEHPGEVSSAAFSPDGSHVVTVSGNIARIWDPATRKVLGPPLAHKGLVRSTLFSPDGSRIVTASQDGTVRVWDIATGQPLGPPLVHQGWAISAAFSPDGSRVVTAGRDTVQVWDTATGQPLGPPLVHQGWAISAAFSPDGSRVVIASHGTVQVWDTATGQPLGPPLMQQAEVWSAALSPDGSRVVIVSLDHTARVWDATTGQPLSPPLAHQDYVRSAAFSPDSSRVVTASLDRTARIWDAATGQPLGAPLMHQDSVLSAAFSPNGSRVVTASGDYTARVWDAVTGQPLGAPLSHRGPVNSAAFSLDGSRVVTASRDQTAGVWGAVTDMPLSTPLRHDGAVVSAAFSSDGSRVVTASKDHTARIWDAATGQPLGPPLAQGNVLQQFIRTMLRTFVRIPPIGHSPAMAGIVDDLITLAGVHFPPRPLYWRPMNGVVLNPDGSRVITASWDGTAQIWSTATGKPLTPPLAHRGSVNSAAFSPDGTRVVTASSDQTARVWNVATGKPLTPPLTHRGPVNRAAFSPDGTRVVTASSDQTARVWNAATGKPLTPPLAHQGDVVSAAFSPDGSRVITASSDQTARVWDAATGKPLTPPLAHQGFVNSAAFSPDGSRVITASWDGTAQVWSAATGKPLTPPLAHRGSVNSAAFSPDGTRVVTASSDQTARIWDAVTGKPLTPPLTHQGIVSSAAFSPDGSRLVTAGEDRTAWVWEIGLDKTPPKDWFALAARSPYALINGILVLRNSLASSAEAPR